MEKILLEVWQNNVNTEKNEGSLQLCLDVQ